MSGVVSSAVFDDDGDVWAKALADPAFVESLDRGRADVAAGRSYILDTETGVISPNPDWPKDGPQPKPPRDFVTMLPIEVDPE